MKFRRNSAALIVRLGDALNSLAIRIDPDAPTREYRSDIEGQLAYIEEEELRLRWIEEERLRHVGDCE